MSELWQHTAGQLSALLGTGEVSAVDVTESVLERLRSVEDDVKAFITITEDEAKAKARKVDEMRSAGEDPGPIAGVPVALKDIFVTKGIRSTAASKILENYVPGYSSTAAARCDAAGLPLLGKTNLDEFAMGSSTENSAYFETRNPWNLSKVPGGSSGGSAAAVASGQAVWALGTDTGGSIRQPAALCGVVGVKPTYGLVSRYGMIAFASSLDQAGPFTRDVRDAALLLDAIAGQDPKDATSLPIDHPSYAASLEGGVDGMRIGVVKELAGEGLQEGVKIRFDEAVSVLEKLGAEIGEVSLPSFEYGIDVYYLIAPAEASSNLARYDGVRYGLRVDGEDIVQMNSKTRAAGFGPEVKRRIMLGTYSLSAGYYDQYYGKAQKARTLIIRDFERAYGEFDLLVSPTSPTTAFGFGERTDDPLTMYLSDICNVPTSLAGAAAISVPCGLAPEDQMPVGIQIMAKALDEPTMFRAAYAFEQSFRGRDSQIFPELVSR
ncbi:MAG: Asp-tRNA(Asn)/Glu-tRNA(Gln) amidotransferase subunit GatA [Actinobacteria bacterium]|nr:Asp-tRNA(Asn)/Glu-tRNA(Gln) amidotransferase subunit GatA [Actinomycetota bacterium]